MIKPFADSTFVVTLTGECPESKIIDGWHNVLRYINSQIGVENDNAPGSFFNPCCDIHDEDAWGTLGHCYRDNDDERHTFNDEIDEGVYLSITRITEYETATA